VTDCMTWRDELLEAAPDELAGVAPTALSDHVRSCGHCGPTARLLLAEHARLGNTLSLLQPRRSADAAAMEVLGALDVPQPIRYRRRDRLQQFAATIFPMAAAAALAIYVVYGRGEQVPRRVTPVERSITHVRITAPPGTGTIVLTTSDPDITFAWFGQEPLP